VSIYLKLKKSQVRFINENLIWWKKWSWWV